MKLYLHGGLHKTATTSFQVFCTQNADTLRDLGLHYPQGDNGAPHHYLLPIALCQHDGPGLLARLQAFAPEAEEAGCTGVLISSENFENCLVDTDLGACLETLAHKAGFESVEWSFVYRDPWSYFNSLYAELSKHEVAVSYRAAVAEIIRFGTWTLASRNFQWKFVFDYDRYFDRFRGAVAGPVHFIRYTDFVSDGLGMPVFARIFADRPEAVQSLVPLLAAHHGGRNARLNSLRVEFNYVANFFMISRKAPALLFIWAFLPLAMVRTLAVAIHRRRLAPRFNQRFARQTGPDGEIIA